MVQQSVNFSTVGPPYNNNIISNATSCCIMLTITVNISMHINKCVALNLFNNK
jgi:hypothetical protein